MYLWCNSQTNKFYPAFLSKQVFWAYLFVESFKVSKFQSSIFFLLFNSDIATLFYVLLSSLFLFSRSFRVGHNYYWLFCFSVLCRSSPAHRSVAQLAHLALFRAQFQELVMFYFALLVPFFALLVPFRTKLVSVSNSTSRFLPSNR